MSLDTSDSAQSIVRALFRGVVIVIGLAVTVAPLASGLQQLGVDVQWSTVFRLAVGGTFTLAIIRAALRV